MTSLWLVIGRFRVGAVVIQAAIGPGRAGGPRGGVVSRPPRLVHVRALGVVRSVPVSGAGGDGRSDDRHDCSDDH
jgi:hypothetical protein